jgi:type II secretory pathway component GspD/PulD (secretin)
MKRTTFLFCCLFLCFLQVNANNSQEIPQITIQFKNQTLGSALSQLAKEGPYQFIFQDTIVNTPDTINHHFTDKTITHILDVLLSNSNYMYSDYGRWAIIHKKKDNLYITTENQESSLFSISGTVVDENGKPIYGAAVCIKRKDIANLKEDCTLTNKNGQFVISTTNPNAYIIVLCINYKTRAVHIRDAELIKLELDLELLDEIIRIGNYP